MTGHVEFSPLPTLAERLHDLRAQRSHFLREPFAHNRRSGLTNNRQLSIRRYRRERRRRLHSVALHWQDLTDPRAGRPLYSATFDTCIIPDGSSCRLLVTIAELIGWRTAA